MYLVRNDITLFCEDLQLSTLLLLYLTRLETNYYGQQYFNIFNILFIIYIRHIDLFSIYAQLRNENSG